MNKIIIKRLGNLLCVKSLVTLVLTGVFAYMAVTETISQDFMTVYAVVIAFYFGTQSQKVQDTMEGAGAPAKAQRSEFRGGRTNTETSEPSTASDGEGYGG